MVLLATLDKNSANPVKLSREGFPFTGTSLKGNSREAQGGTQTPNPRMHATTPHDSKEGRMGSEASENTKGFPYHFLLDVLYWMAGLSF